MKVTGCDNSSSLEVLPGCWISFCSAREGVLCSPTALGPHRAPIRQNSTTFSSETKHSTLFQTLSHTHSGPVRFSVFHKYWDSAVLCENQNETGTVYKACFHCFSEHSELFRIKNSMNLFIPIVSNLS